MMMSPPGRRGGKATPGPGGRAGDRRPRGAGQRRDGKAFFTRKGDALYLHLLEWPEEPVVVSGLRAVGQPRARLLGVERPVSVRASGESLVLALPPLSPNHTQAAYVAKLEGLRLYPN